MGTSPVEKSTDSSINTQEGSNAQSEEFQWSIENEVHLFNAMLGNKPAGINKHFNMALICEKFTTSSNKPVTSECIWKYLEDLYNFEILDDIEGIPFPNDQKDFSLPENEYGPLMKQKLKDISIKVDEPEDRSASPRTLSSRSSSRGAASKENNAKSSAKKDSDKSTKAANNKDSSANDKVSDSITSPNKSTEKESKTDPRRDSKDSTSSNKDSSKTPNTGNKTPKDNKSTKSSRSSVVDKSDDTTKSSDDSNSAKRSFKRSTRGSLKSEEPTPPSRRRRI